jgi:signal peptidase II
VLKKSLLVIFLVLFIDQAVKIWVKTHMAQGDEIVLFSNWASQVQKLHDGVLNPNVNSSFARLHFTENNGMAFGMEFEGNYGKLFLSVFRIIAVCAIGWYLFTYSKKKKITLGLAISLSFIFAGAIGNIIDSAFYGMIFNDSYFQVAQFMPDGGGYGSFLHGKVVDMLYFPIIQGHFPQWFPFWKGEDFEFFRPVFNISDASITTGVLMLVVFQKRYFRKPDANKMVEAPLNNENIDGTDVPPQEQQEK